MRKKKLYESMDDINDKSDYVNNVIDDIINSNQNMEFNTTVNTNVINPYENLSTNEIIEELWKMHDHCKKTIFKSKFKVEYDDFVNGNISAYQKAYIERLIEMGEYENYVDDLNNSPFMPIITDTMTRMVATQIICKPRTITIPIINMI